MGVLKRKQTLLGKEGIGPAFARGQRVRDRWESFLEVTLGLSHFSSNNQPSRSNRSRPSRATIRVIICLSGV
jgi:hypothetical protein